MLGERRGNCCGDCQSAVSLLLQAPAFPPGPRVPPAVSPAESPQQYPWGRLNYICNSKTSKSVSVSVISGKLFFFNLENPFKSVSVISGVQV